MQKTTDKNLREYVKASASNSEKSRREYTLYGHVYVYVQDFLPENIDIVSVLETIENTIPSHLVNEVDTIFIGDFHELKSRAMTAMYDSGAVYVSNEQDNEKDMVDDIIHEIAHSLEYPYGWYIYSDEVLENEFLRKRLQAYEVLYGHEYVKKAHKAMFLNVEYTEEFDEFLYKEVGYDKLVHLLMGIFTTPYAATSLREYFATGLEDYFLNDRAYLKKLCPNLFTKVDKLTKGDYDE
tara:strand:+ start:192 stop:905 length:714 start_codon:yes stop_codon:yes gene_type:complete